MSPPERVKGPRQGSRGVPLGTPFLSEEWFGSKKHWSPEVLGRPEVPRSAPGTILDRFGIALGSILGVFWIDFLRLSDHKARRPDETPARGRPEAPPDDTINIMRFTTGIEFEMSDYLFYCLRICIMNVSIYNLRELGF